MADDSLMEKWANRNTNRILKLNMAIEHFMTSSNTAPRVARRFTYAIRGMYSVINKLNVATLTAGKALEGLKGFFTNPEASKGIKIFGGALSKISKTLGPKGIANFFSSSKRAYQGIGAYGLAMGSQEGDSAISRKDRMGMIVGKLKERAGLRFGKDARGSLMEKLEKNASKVLNFFNNNWRGIGGKLWNFLKLSGKMMFLAMFYITAIALAISLVYPVLKEGSAKMWEGIKESAAWIGEALGLVWEGVSDIFGFLFGDKTFTEMIDGFLKIGFGLLWVAWAVIWGVIKAAWDLTTEIIKVGFWKFVDYLGKVYEESKVKFFFVIVGLVTALVAWALGLPVILPALLLYIGWKLVGWLWDKMTSISFFAGGGVSKGGLAVVGERGPELVNLPRGSRVHSNRDSRKMVSSGGSTINVTINAHSLQDTELRRIAQRVGDMINRQVNRGTSSSTVR